MKNISQEARYKISKEFVPFSLLSEMWTGLETPHNYDLPADTLERTPCMRGKKEEKVKIRRLSRGF